MISTNGAKYEKLLIATVSATFLHVIYFNLGSMNTVRSFCILTLKKLERKMEDCGKMPVRSHPGGKESRNWRREDVKNFIKETKKVQVSVNCGHTFSVCKQNVRIQYILHPVQLSAKMCSDFDKSHRNNNKYNPTAENRSDPSDGSKSNI